MDAPVGETQTLVVRISPDASGAWWIMVEEAGISQSFPLQPLICSIKLWRPANANLLRASLRLHGSGQTAAIQSNRLLLPLLFAWLKPQAVPPDPDKIP